MLGFMLLLTCMAGRDHGRGSITHGDMETPAGG